MKRRWQQKFMNFMWRIILIINFHLISIEISTNVQGPQRESKKKGKWNGNIKYFFIFFLQMIWFIPFRLNIIDKTICYFFIFVQKYSTISSFLTSFIQFDFSINKIFYFLWFNFRYAPVILHCITLNRFLFMRLSMR